jgi:hypothetical protein
MLPYVIGSVVLALVVGFAAGFVTFRRSLKWCPSCGAGLRCIECTSRRATAIRSDHPAGRLISERRAGNA